MKLLIVKGRSGLGNRLRALGNAYDISMFFKCPMFVDWEDSCWGQPMNEIFLLDYPRLISRKVARQLYSESRNCFPKAYTDTCLDKGMSRCVTGNVKHFKKFIHTKVFPSPALEKFSCAPEVHFYTDAGERAIDPDVLVWSSFGHDCFSDDYLNHLTIVPDLIDEIKNTLTTFNLSPGTYNAWHYRCTDRHVDISSDSFLSMVKKASLSEQIQVVCTDHAYTAERIRNLGNPFIVCTSAIPETKPKQGPHAVKSTELEKQGLSKNTLFRSAVSDLFLLGLAKNIEVTCQESTYARFANRGKESGWFTGVLYSTDKGIAR